MSYEQLEQLLSKHNLDFLLDEETDSKNIINLINDCDENAAKACNSLDWSGRSDETLAKYDAVEECVSEICKLKLDNH